MYKMKLLYSLYSFECIYRKVVHISNKNLVVPYDFGQNLGDFAINLQSAILLLSWLGNLIPLLSDQCNNKIIYIFFKPVSICELP